MHLYFTKARKLSGTSFGEVRKKAFQLYLSIKKKSKRKPYVRSAYFDKQKIFLDLFWTHLFEKKNFVDLMRRTKLYPCALELIQKSKFQPISKTNVDRQGEVLHRFAGATPEKELFFVQIKEDKKTQKKWFISVFPVDK